VVKNKSLLGTYWQIKDCEERLILSSSQQNQISPIIAQLLLVRQIDEDLVDDFLEPSFIKNIPNPFELNDMDKSISRTIKALKNNETIGIIADYDVDGSTSAAILFNFLSLFNKNIIIKIPDRLNEGYGPNIRIMEELIDKEVKLNFSLDCGTSAFNIIDNQKYNSLDTIIIDHHISELKLPNVFSIINPNRYDEKNSFKNFAAVGVTFLFLMGLRKKIREIGYFIERKIKEPNLLNYLDLVALGTVCDVVKLKSFNRNFVHQGLEIIQKRTNKGISQIFDNSNINHPPTSTDLAFILGPQLNAASRIGDSNLSSRLLITKDLVEIENISKKLMLLNEKRKLIENNVFEEALEMVNNNNSQKFILVYGKKWHIGVLGIIASRLVEKFNKPSIVISLDQNIGIGSARSIENIDLGNIILLAKHNDIIINGGGHKMAAGLRINKNKIDIFHDFLSDAFKNFDDSIFQKNQFYDTKISVNEINEKLLSDIEKLEPYGNGNEEPKFLVDGLIIEYFKTLKDKHLMIFFKNNYGELIKGICFNCIGTEMGENLMINKSSNFKFVCIIKRDNFNNSLMPQLIIRDVIIVN
jgi:single-stranded-DNA-specific exonuclease